MSKRSKRRRDPETAERERAAPRGEAAAGERTGSGGRSAAAAGGVSRRPQGSAGLRAASDWGLGVQIALLVAVFAVVVLVAELAGAANLGVALGIGQVAFAIAVAYLLVRR